ncbi:hypothetical protein CKF54_02860 [Psittacicella hinzii]|uniref:Aminotransferase class I/classII large domain-containing protein n=1 Tax=Psittacicella hinzii TaxID=2028575 RepID=A0A3A1Y536_9GAMM|nr:pyridoxal phosphate-dependent aminotransferase family protein [Psittacicella hinzii]RIY33402.1 hypothetical protein CKF54_02860 [Psittacicella hinzii]
MKSFNETITNFLDNLKDSKNYRFLGKYSNKEAYRLDLSSNDYLGLASLDFNTVLEQTKNSSSYYQPLQLIIQDYLKDKKGYSLPKGSTGSRLLSGDNHWFNSVESSLNQILKPYDKEVLFYNSGYHANLGIIPVLKKFKELKPLILMDRLMHASFIDGVILSELPFKRFKHNDLNDLKSKIDQAVADQHRLIVIALESIYSMDGDNISEKSFIELVNLKEAYKDKLDILLYVDEAHAVGMFGKHSLGLVDKYNLLNKIDFVVCPLGKATNSSGALVITSSIIKELLVNTSRPLIYSTSLGIETVMASSLHLCYANTQFAKEKASLIIGLANDFRTNIISYLENRLQEMDLDPNRANEYVGGENQIVSFVVKSNAMVDLAYNFFKERGILLGAIKSPTVAKNKERLRVCFNTNLLDSLEYKFLLDSFRDFILSKDFEKALTS